MDEFCRLMRMPPDTYAYILGRLEKHIAKKDTNLHKSISASERLSVTLKYYATGKNAQVMSSARC